MISMNKNKWSAWAKPYLSSIPAGMYISLAAFLSVIASYSVETPSIAKILSALVFPLGLALIFATGSKLFTGQVIQYQNTRDARHFMQITVSLAIIYIGNLIGSVLTVLLFKNGLALDNQIIVKMAQTAAAKVNLTPVSAFLSGIICNLCVVGAVALRARGQSVIMSLVPVFAFVMLGAEHIVADFTYITIGLLQKSISFSEIWNLVFFVTAGNYIGGLIIAVPLRKPQESKHKAE